MVHSVLTGLSPSGIGSYLAKLKDEDILEICNLRKSGLKVKEIGEIYGVSSGGISAILSGKTWKHIKREYFQPESKNSLKASDIPLIRAGFEEGMTDTEIGELFSVARGTIQQIRSGKNWKNY